MRLWARPLCAATQSPDQLAQPLSGSRPLFVTRIAGPGVRQLLRDFRKIDLEVMDKNVMHVFCEPVFELVEA